MKNKIVWLLVSCLMMASLVLASCGPVTPTTTPPTTTPPTVSPTITPTTTPTKEEPTYGGTITICITSVPVYDPASLTGYVANNAYESLIQQDWARGPSGSREFLSTLNDWWIEPQSFAGLLAESWEQPNPTTFIFHLRKGVKFQNVPPANGRELDANDVVWSNKYMQSNPRWINYKAPDTPVEKTFRFTALDKYTVQVITPEPDAMVLNDWPHLLRILPREFEGVNLNDWKNNCGTGPWIRTDHVPGSSTTVERNPDYWMMDPLHPKNRLPYADKIIELIIPDRATQLAGLRTGKIDYLPQVERVDGKDIIARNPELKYSKSARDVTRVELTMRVDRPPLDNKKVRQALHMAIDWDAWVQQYYEGEAIKLTRPYYPYHTGYYTPLEELPANLQALYTRDVTKAKQLLAEAGYANGFKVSADFSSASAQLVEPLSLIKDWWKDIGVDFQLNMRDPAAMSAIFYAKKYDYMYAMRGVSGNAAPEMMWRQFCKPGHPYNYYMLNDPYINEQYAKVCNTLDINEQKRIEKELGIYFIDLCPEIIGPSAYSLTIWWPWLKGQSGEVWSGPYWMMTYVLQYCWVDKEIKDRMGH
jgi:peptide/nickel transport system substrate-binding protein